MVDGSWYIGPDSLGTGLSGSGEPLVEVVCVHMHVPCVCVCMCVCVFYLILCRCYMDDV